MRNKKFKYNFILPIFLLIGFQNFAQLGGPLLNLTFGQAASDNLLLPGPAMQLGFTDIPYNPNTCPDPGTYSVVSGLNTNCFANSWIPLYNDNTPYPDNNGYMMLINDVSRNKPVIFFRDTIHVANCPQINYQFSVAAINVDKPSNGCTRFSSLTLQVEDGSGNLIAEKKTGDIQFAVYSMGYHFTNYVVDFTLPANTNTIVVKILDDAKSTSITCSNGLALDDIKLAVTGPKISIGFASTPIGEWVKSTCYQNNVSYTMLGQIDPGIDNPAVQWQQSVDNGLNWFDIPGATGYSYTNQFSIPDTFLFRLRGSEMSIIDFQSCSIASNLLKVEVNGIPKEYSAANNSPLCAGKDLIFTVTGGSTYKWWGPNGFSGSGPYTHIYHSTLEDSGMYYVQILSQGGCTILDSSKAVMIGTDIHLTKDTSICNGMAVQLHAEGGLKYQWSPATDLSNVAISNPIATPKSDINYNVIINDFVGCEINGSVRINLKNQIAVKAKFESPGYLCSDDLTAIFRDESTGVIKNWNWDFGNGVSSNLQNPLLQHYSGTYGSEYKISLQVADTAGCTDSIQMPLKLAPNCFIAVPNVFTPNSDGKNDYLYPLNAYKATNLIFSVYNRNGQLVFQTRDWTKKWDGSFRGQPQAAGAYVWTLKYQDEKHKTISLKGTSILVR